MTIWNKIRTGQWIPRTYLLMLVFNLLYNSLIYYSGQWMGTHTKAWNIEISLDNQIPVIPWFVGIYFSFFLFCAVNFLLMGYYGKKKACLFLCAELLAKTVCGIFYLCFPTTNLRPEIVGTDFWSRMLVELYQMDAAVNLFPSIHCMDSWFCVVVLRNIRKVPGWYMTITWIWAVAICASTLFTKQHGILDVAAGIALAELSYICVIRWKKTERFRLWMKKKRI